MEAEILAALLAVLDHRLPGLSQQLMVVLDVDLPAPGSVVVPFQRPPRPTQLQACVWAERAERLLREARIRGSEDQG